MSLTSKLAGIGGDCWASSHCFAVWPWPAVIFGDPRTKFSWDDYRVFTKYLRPGDLLLMKSHKFKLSNFAISGTAFKHLAVYTGAVEGYRDNKSGFIMKPRSLGVNYEHTGNVDYGFFERTVTHAISEGVVTQDLGEALFHADYVVAVRPHGSLSEQVDMVRAALALVGVEYNFDFTPDGPAASYCTELGAYCCTKAGIAPPEKILSNVSIPGMLVPLRWFKAPVYLADYFLKYEAVCASVSCNEPSFFRNSLIRETVRIACLHAPDALTRDDTNGRK